VNLIEKTEAFGTHQCRQFRAAIFRRHDPVGYALASGFLRRASACRDPLDGNRDGNTWLRVVDERLRVGKERFSATADDDEIRSKAELMAALCERTYAGLLVGGVAAGSAPPAKSAGKQVRAGVDFQEAVEAVQSIVEREGVAWPVEIKPSDKPEDIRGKLAAAVSRACDPLWWRRQLRKLLGRAVEAVLRESGVVRKAAAPYVSNWAFTRWKAQQRRNAGTIAQLDAECESTGELVPLSLCVDASVANPENRRNELMVRMRGWEEIATAMQLRGTMLTLTAPSKYHCQLHRGGINPKFNGATPRATMEYLNTVWERIRAKWQRQGIRAFGFRITEPHHDGTPHCHFLLFFSPDQIDRAWSIFRAYALAEDGSEPGAEDRRCDRVDIDPAKGTAAGYVAKYVSKNIDGYGIGSGEVDDEGAVFAHEGAARARAWGSLWGIRQFQQVGACSVTVYRELRRNVEAMADEPDEVKRLTAAADAGDWAQFVELMGGAFVKRNEQLLRPLREIAAKPGRYGEEIKRLLGLALNRVLSGYIAEWCLSHRIVTRAEIWKIVPRWVRRQMEGPPG